MNFLGNSRGTLAPWAPRVVGFFIFPPWALIRVLVGLMCKWAFFLLKLGPWVLFRPRPHPSYSMKLKSKSIFMEQEKNKY